MIIYVCVATCLYDFGYVTPGFLGVCELVLEELRHLVAHIVRNAVLCQEAA